MVQLYFAKQHHVPCTEIAKRDSRGQFENVCNDLVPDARTFRLGMVSRVITDDLDGHGGLVVTGFDPATGVFARFLRPQPVARPQPRFQFRTAHQQFVVKQVRQQTPVEDAMSVEISAASDFYNLPRDSCQHLIHFRPGIQFAKVVGNANLTIDWRIQLSFAI
jgi:hypothetical protein